jgi:putative addiction module component (TIGR02574 family)
MRRSPKMSAVLRDALSLSKRDRFDVAAALLASVDNDGVGASVDAAWASEARRRLAEVRSGVAKPVPWADAEKRIFDGK